MIFVTFELVLGLYISILDYFLQRSRRVFLGYCAFHFGLNIPLLMASARASLSGILVGSFGNPDSNYSYALYRNFDQ